MGEFNRKFNDLVNSLARLPGIGKRSAERLAYYILKMPQADSKELAAQIEDISKFIKPCSLCNNFSTNEVCDICANPKRDQDEICIVEEPKDIIAVEKTAHYNGLYYVILGSISPLDGIDAKDLNISKLIRRLEAGHIKEAVIATDPDTEGELTAQFLVEKISPFKIKLFRLAIGIPLGTQIEYVDSSTLAKALQERRAIT